MRVEVKYNKYTMLVYRLPFQLAYFVTTYSIEFVIEVTGDLYLKGICFNLITLN